MIGGYQKGRGAQINPNNKYLSRELVKAHIEGIDEESTINHQRKIYILNHLKKSFPKTKVRISHSGIP